MPRPDRSEFEQLPYMPWDRRPDTLPIDVEGVATALFIADGDLHKAADLYKITPAQLHKAIRKSQRLQNLLKRFA